MTPAAYVKAAVRLVASMGEREKFALWYRYARRRGNEPMLAAFWAMGAVGLDEGIPE